MTTHARMEMARNRHVRKLSSNRKKRAKKRKRDQRRLLVNAKREKRLQRSKRRRLRARGKPWWHRWWLEKNNLEKNFPPEYASHFSRRTIGKALVYSGEVEIPHTGHVRQVAIIFKGRPREVRPIVMVDGPRTRRHRFNTYRPLPLCIWYWRDPKNMRWNVRDGLAGLIDLTRLHLGKEAYFRITGSWPGAEVHLQPELSADRPQLSKRKSAKAALKKRRERCWCGGDRRYRRCHGNMSEEDELVALGLE